MELSNTNIERGLLSAIIFNATEVEKIKSILKSSDFFNLFHRYVYETIIFLAENEKPITEEFIISNLQKVGHFDELAMLDILSANPISNVEQYANKIKELSNFRRTRENIKSLLNIDELAMLDAEIAQLYEEKENYQSLSDWDDEDINEIREEDPKFILRNWLPFPMHALSMISGKGGVGKSWLIMQIALRYCIENPNKKVLAWLSEDPRGISKSRAVKITKDLLHTDITQIKNLRLIGSDSKTQPFHVVSLGKELTIAEKWHQFKQKYKDFDLIIWDPLIAFYGADENNNSQARVFTTLLNAWATRHKKTILVIHHTAKGEENKLRGASAFRDAIRLNYTVEEDKEKDDHRLIGLEKDNWGAIKVIVFDDKKQISIKIFPRSLVVPVEIENEKYGEKGIFLREFDFG